MYNSLNSFLSIALGPFIQDNKILWERWGGTPFKVKRNLLLTHGQPVARAPHSVACFLWLKLASAGGQKSVYPVVLYGSLHSDTEGKINVEEPSYIVGCLVTPLNGFISPPPNIFIDFF